MPTEEQQENNMENPISEIIKNVTKAVEIFADNLKKYDFSKVANNFIAPFYELSLEIEEAKKNPESLINYLEYVKKLSDYFWAMPYQIDGKSLKYIFENVNSEQEFDTYMQEYFTDEKIDSIFQDIQSKISENHQVILEQIIAAFKNNYYALINNSLISIIDNELSFYIENKRETTRKNIFTPIIKDLKDVPIKECNWINIIFLEMLENNIKIIFDFIHFDNISITTKKTIRRHTTQHGVMYSNEKIDSLMLINTLYNILYTKDYLLDYENKLEYSRKEKKFIYKK